MMVYGHTGDALLGRGFRAGLWFDVWRFQRGLTSCLFLLLSGFAFSIATTRHWGSHIRFTRSLLHRIRRFALFVFLGYVLHFPVDHIAKLRSLPDAAWRGFVAVDVLQLIGVTLIALQILVLISQSRRVFMALCFALSVVMIVTTPALWRVDWTTMMPMTLAAYLSPAIGSQFPVFPWSAYVLLGAGLGQIYARWGAGWLGGFTIAALLAPGVLISGVMLTAGGLSIQLFGSDEWSWVPPEVLRRIGAILVLLGVIAHASRRLAHLPHIFGAVAQESLLVYFVHLCIIYGSIWNLGLTHFFPDGLNPAATLLVILLLLAAMAAKSADA